MTIKKFSLDNLISLKTFRLSILLFILVEELSLLGYFLPSINTLVFFFIVALTVVLSLIKIEYGLYILLAELFIGSKGYLFYFDFAGISISIRIAIFLIMVGIYLLRVFQGKVLLNFLKSKFSISYFLFFIFLVFGFIRGIIGRHSFDNLFFDFNNWLFFALIFIFFDVIVSWSIIKNIISIFMATAVVLFIKTSFLFWLFARQGIWRYLAYDFYRWIRLTQIGEITKISENFYRIFIQSQVFYLFGFFLSIGMVLYLLKEKKLKLIKNKLFGALMFVFLCSFPLFISFSRSFWLGLIVALATFIIIFKIKRFISWTEMIKFGSALLLILFLVFGFTALLIYPNKPVGAVEKRLTTTANEPAAISRFQELGPLLTAITEAPILGSGFGQTVTYRTADPRTIETTGAEYTTYAFEWGYLDIWLKIGIVGLFVYLFLIWKIWQKGWQILISNFNPPVGGQISNILIIGLLFGLLAIVITNITSPYLNHPLGIGYLLITTAIFETLCQKFPSK